MGYLEPRPRRIPQYLQLLNHAPELLLPEFQDSRSMSDQPSSMATSDTHMQQSMSQPSAFKPVGPYSRAAAAAAVASSNVNTSLSPNTVCYSHVFPKPHQQSSSSCISFQLDSEDPSRGSVYSSQAYGVVGIQDPSCLCEVTDVAERLVVDLTDLSRLKALQRKFSDQDLYGCPSQYNQQQRHSSSTSSTPSDHPYTRVLDPLNNNNYSFTSAGSNRMTPAHYTIRDSRLDSNHSFSSRTKLPSSSSWGNHSVSESSSVFEQDEGCSFPPPYVNVQNQYGVQSHGQLFTDNSTTFADFDIAQASLV